MKKKEWNEGLNYLDADLVEKYTLQKDRLRQKGKKAKGVWIRVGAIAACFLLIVSAMIVVPMLREDDPIVQPSPETTGNDLQDTPDPLSGTYSFDSFEDFKQHEKRAGEKAISYYYTPDSLPDDYELLRITKRDDTYVMVEYALSASESLQTSGLNEYDTERLTTLICRYSLYSDGEQALQKNFISKGYEPLEHNGRIYYCLYEYAENDPNKQKIGYEIAFLEDGDLIFMHLPAVDSFENMMKFARVAKVKLD